MYLSVSDILPSSCSISTFPHNFANPGGINQLEQLPWGCLDIGYTFSMRYMPLMTLLAAQSTFDNLNQLDVRSADMRLEKHLREISSSTKKREEPRAENEQRAAANAAPSCKHCSQQSNGQC